VADESLGEGAAGHHGVGGVAAVREEEGGVGELGVAVQDVGLERVERGAQSSVGVLSTRRGRVSPRCSGTLGAMKPPVHFEDFAVGQVYELGAYQISREEILDFARRFDPQPFHVDERAAEDSVFGGLIASGWHTASIFMRCYADNLLDGSTSMGSPGVEQLRWLAPVRPGDTLSARVTVADLAPSASRADRGTVFLLSELRNQRDEVVLSMTARALFGRRPS